MKKIYFAPSTELIKVKTNTLLAGSIEANITTSEDQRIKSSDDFGARDNTVQYHSIWDD